MRDILEVRHNIELLERRNEEINDALKNVEPYWAHKVGNPLIYEFNRNISKIVALKWVAGDLDDLP